MVTESTMYKDIGTWSKAYTDFVTLVCKHNDTLLYRKIHSVHIEMLVISV